MHLHRYNLRSYNKKNDTTQKEEHFYDAMPGDEQKHNLEEKRAHPRSHVQVPKFNKTNPAIWFAQIERYFRLHGITDDIDKFDWVAVSLDEDVVLTVEHLLTQPPANNSYDAIKTRLLDKYAESAESKLKRLMQGGETAGMKPSEVLAHMRRLAPDPRSEPIIRTLFLSDMPKSIRPLLTVWDEDDLDKLAKLADKMLESTSTLSVCEISSQPAVSIKDDMLVELNKSIQALSKQVSNLQGELDQVKRSRVNRNNSRSQSSHNRSGSQQRAPTPTEARGSQQHSLCYFHTKYGDNANKCRPNCARWVPLN